MRADRLLMLMLLLQTRGKMTTYALAKELGVSRRTILRDIDALSFSGVPILSEGGHGGGVALDEQYRTTLTGLQTPELRSLFVASTGTALKDVGLGDASESLVLKLLAALPAMHRPTVDHIRQRLMIDPAWWWHDAENPPFWDDLQKAVYEDHLIAVRYEHYNGEVVERALEPYSLVNKSSLWYLIGRREDGEMRTYRVSRFHQLQLLDETFVRQADFDLQSYWSEHQQEFIESFSNYRCVLRVETGRVSFVKWLMPGRWEIDGEDARGWAMMRLMLDSELMAKMLVFGLGAACEVVEPPDLADAVLSDAKDIVQRFS